VLDACGKDIILIETVGAGQDEVEVASMAETTVVVLTPGSGDDVQAMKAGMMEVADIVVVNKADLPGAEGVISQVRAALNLASRGRLDTPVIESVAPKGTGIPELADAIEAHRRNLETSGEMDNLRVQRARRQVLLIVRQLLMDEILLEAKDGRLDALAEDVASRELDPYSAAKRLITDE
jgi:LAO/AO transport system kinase